MTLAYRDANSQTQPLATGQTVASELAPVHLVSSVVNGVATPTSLTNPLPVEVAAGLPAADGSGTIVTGGAAQTMFGGIIPGNGFMVANNSAAELYVSDVGTATAGGASIPIPPAGVFVTPTGYKPAGTVSIIGTTTGQAFAARRW